MTTIHECGVDSLITQSSQMGLDKDIVFMGICYGIPEKKGSVNCIDLLINCTRYPSAYYMHFRYAHTVSNPKYTIQGIFEQILDGCNIPVNLVDDMLIHMNEHDEDEFVKQNVVNRIRRNNQSITLFDLTYSMVEYEGYYKKNGYFIPHCGS